MKLSITVFFALCLGSIAFAQTPPSGGTGPCKQVQAACSSAGFILGDAKLGNGLWMDCINPIMQGQTIPNPKIPLPAVDPSVVAACKAKNAKFGMGKIGSMPTSPAAQH